MLRGYDMSLQSLVFTQLLEIILSRKTLYVKLPKQFLMLGNLVSKLPLHNNVEVQWSKDHAQVLYFVQKPFFLNMTGGI